MEPGVHAAIIRSNAAKDSSSQKPKPKSLEDPGERTNLDPKFISSQQHGDNHHTPEGALSDQLVKRSEHLEDPHGMVLRRLHFELDRIDKWDADQESEEEEEESRSVLDADNESLFENGVVCAQADELLIGFSAVSMSDAAAVDDEDELCPAAAAAYDDIYDLLLIPDDDDDDDEDELCPAAAAVDDIYDLLLLLPEDDDELLLADGFETPIAMPSSPDCGIAKVFAKTCPWAPMKPGMERRNFKNRVDNSICKKLQF